MNPNDNEEERQPNSFDVDDESGVYFLQQVYQYHETLVEDENCPMLTRNSIHYDLEGAEDRLMDDYFDDHCKKPTLEDVEKGYYLADGIYPQWATFVKSITVRNDAKHSYFKKHQESARKDSERAFGVLQERWGINNN
uniref:Nucleotide-binding, alpha-beta plait n=1 Tax=Tanacetum cinerariifolium TaxID=118510 RepID=A0A699IA58_TANCI|nr:nucleotide-binding, alpha-beta plait [Tanacetum cinerariifolium]